MKKMVLMVMAGMTLSGCNNITEYMAHGRGKARFAEAEQDRQIAILEAKAKLESAQYLAKAEIERAQSLATAEVIRAEGVAKANKIIGESLKGNEAYLRYRWIEGLQTNNMSVVYVPTEAGLPILEANRWSEERNRK